MSDNGKGKMDNQNVDNASSPPAGGNESASGDSSGNESYSTEFVTKLKKEKDNFRSETQSLRDKIAEMEANQKAREEQELKEKEDWKTLFEKANEEKKNLEGKLTTVADRELSAKKESELKKELAKLGVKQNYVEKAAKLAQLDSVKIDNETGVIYGADVVAKTLSEEWPDLFGSGASETVRQSAPQTPTSTGVLSLDEWQKLPYEERKKREGDLLAGLK